MVFFEAPHRILDALEDAQAVLGPDRQASVARELTKKFEHVERGTLAELIDWAKSEPKGEMVLVIAGAKPDQFDYDEDDSSCCALLQRLLWDFHACKVVQRRNSWYLCAGQVSYDQLPSTPPGPEGSKGRRL